MICVLKILIILNNKFNIEFYFGNLCFGYGIILNNWGIEYMKLKIWGMKNSNMVLLKCFKIVIIVKVIFEK